MASKWLLVAPVAGRLLGVGAGIGLADKLLSANEAKQDLEAGGESPDPRGWFCSTRVWVTSSRSGEVENEARVDLMFPETDINDLLKSMVLEDFNKGRISRCFLRLTRADCPHAHQLRHQPQRQPPRSPASSLKCAASRIEVGSVAHRDQPTGAKLTRRTIVGVEHVKVPAGTTTVDAEVLNMWCAEGMRLPIKFGDIQSLRFSNPIIESEFRRALDVLALSHDNQKKAVQLHFAGEGNACKCKSATSSKLPIWKTSYRLVMAEKEKPYLQGWAMVENPTDEDWNGVKMAAWCRVARSALQDGPVQPTLYVDRPTVEPELLRLHSRRPAVTYQGSDDKKPLFSPFLSLGGGGQTPPTTASLECDSDAGRVHDGGTWCV